jgi:hypothetical protein
MPPAEFEPIISPYERPKTYALDQAATGIGKQLNNVEFFNCLSSMKTNDSRCTCEIKSRIAVATAAFNQNKTLFTSRLDCNIRKNHTKCYIWNRDLSDAEIWAVRAVGA